MDMSMLFRRGHDPCCGSAERQFTFEPWQKSPRHLAAAVQRPEAAVQGFDLVLCDCSGERGAGQTCACTAHVSCCSAIGTPSAMFVNGLRTSREHRSSHLLPVCAMSSSMSYCVSPKLIVCGIEQRSQCITLCFSHAPNNATDCIELHDQEKAFQTRLTCPMVAVAACGAQGRVSPRRGATAGDHCCARPMQAVAACLCLTSPLKSCLARLNMYCCQQAGCADGGVMGQVLL